MTHIAEATVMPDVRFDADLVARYDSRGPRYTSYPTALQFSESFSAEDYSRHALASNKVTGPRPLALYVHIPFCRALCYYCACTKIVTRNEQRVGNYLDSLRRELALQAALYDRQRVVEQLHFGGGTPTYLSADQFAALMADIRTNFNLKRSDDREFSIEVDPRGVEPQMIDTLAELGFNRLSLGIQDFDPAVQAAVNRRQSCEAVSCLVERARAAGFSSISFDLIYGLPHQTTGSFSRTLQQVIDLAPDRLAVYNYAHLPERFRGQRMISRSDLPQANEKLEILGLAIEQLTSASYIYIGMDHFALPHDELARARERGELHRNFQGYSTHKSCDLIGVGLSAISNVGGCYVQNAATTAGYEEPLENGRLPVTRGIELTPDDELRAAVIQKLMCYGRIDYERFESEFNLDFRDYFSDALKRLGPLLADGLVLSDPGGIEVTPDGKLLLRSIAMAFDGYLNAAAPMSPHSAVI